MSRSLQFAVSSQVRGVSRLLALVVFLAGAACTLLYSQSSPAPEAPQAAQPAAATEPGVASTPAFSAPGWPAPVWSANPGSARPGGSAPDLLQPGFDFGSFAGYPANSSGFNSFARPSGRQQNSAASLFGPPITGGRPGNTAPLFPVGNGASPNNLPSLNQLMRGSFSMPVASGSGMFRLSFQQKFDINANGAGIDFNRLAATGTITSSNLGNGVFFSAGANYGGRTAGAPAATLPTGTAVGPKHTGPGVALKLSF